MICEQKCIVEEIAVKTSVCLKQFKKRVKLSQKAARRKVSLINEELTEMRGILQMTPHDGIFKNGQRT